MREMLGASTMRLSISATASAGSHVGRIAIGMNLPGYAPAHSSMCQWSYAWIIATMISSLR